MPKARSKAIYEVLKLMSGRMEKLGFKIDDIKLELQALRNERLEMRQNISDLNASIGHHDRRLTLIERRLEMTARPMLP